MTNPDRRDETLSAVHSGTSPDTHLTPDSEHHMDRVKQLLTDPSLTEAILKRKEEAVEAKKAAAQQLIEIERKINSLREEIQRLDNLLRVIEDECAATPL